MRAEKKWNYPCSFETDESFEAVMSTAEGYRYFCFVWVNLSHQMLRTPMTVCNALFFTPIFFLRVTFVFFSPPYCMFAPRHTHHLHCVLLPLLLQDVVNFLSLLSFATETYTIAFIWQMNVQICTACCRRAPSSRPVGKLDCSIGGSWKVPSEQEAKLPFLDAYSFCAGRIIRNKYCSAVYPGSCRSHLSFWAA